ncbi:hypothetical protein [Virgibacillus salexigens]|nr:hypothetical protein [Virgibacillus massiliensis]
MLIIQNQELKASNSSLNTDIHSMETQIQEMKRIEKSEVFPQAKEAAQNFIQTYFKFTDQPDERQVKSFLAKGVEKSLRFHNEIETTHDFTNIVTNVKDLEVYYGDKEAYRQEIFAHFNSEIQVEKNKTSSPTFLRLEMIRIQDDWKVEDIEYMKYE